MKKTLNTYSKKCSHLFNPITPEPVHVVCLSGSLISDPIKIHKKIGPIQIELFNSGL